MTRTIIVMAKAPQPGKAKTRLAATVGDAAACELAEAFIHDLSFMLATVDADVVIAWSGDREHRAFDEARARGHRLVDQGVGTLGERLSRVIRAEAERCDEVIVIGSDSPTLTPGHFVEAFDALSRADVVVGPSFDGGYYLLGVKSAWFTHVGDHALIHPVFADIDWSTEDVFRQTLRQIRSVGGLCELTRFCYDVDTYDDLKLLRTHLLDYLRPSGLDVGRKTAILLSDISKD